MVSKEQVSISVIKHRPFRFHIHIQSQVSQLAFHIGIGVKVKDKENIDRALRRFKRTVNRSRVLRLHRQNMAFTKPSEERRIAEEKAARNARMHNRRY